MKYSLILASVILSSAVVAQPIYKTEKNGVTVYSTSPVPGVAPVKLPELSVVPGYVIPDKSNYTPPTSNNNPANNLPLPPPPPSMSPNGKSPAPVTMTKVEELESALAKAKSELAEQDAIRTGEEKNYQKKLERLKPYEEKVAEFAKQLEALKKQAR